MKDIISTGRIRNPKATTTSDGPDPSWWWWWWWWWWWEIGAGVITLLSIVSVLLLLVKIDHKLRKDWILDPIQPNSLLSIAINLSKTSLLVSTAACISQLKWQHFLRPRRLNELQIFDDASRGPWGSAIMIWKLFSTANRTRTVIGIGLAVSNVLALGIDPSAQQLIALEAKEVRVRNSSVLASRADSYYSQSWDISPASHAGDVANFSQAFPGTEILSRAELNKFNSILHAIPFNSIVNSPEPFYTCPPPALRCEWYDFSTLGICGSFRNVTSSVRQNCTTAILSDNGTFVGYADGKPPNDSNYEGVCEFRFDATDGSIGDIGDNHVVDPIALEFWNNPTDKLTMFGDVFSNVAINTSATVQSIWMVRVRNFTQSFNGSRYTTFESFISDFYWCHKDLQGASASEGGFKTRSTTSRPWASAEGDRFHNGALLCSAKDLQRECKDDAARHGSNDSIGYNTEVVVPYVYNVKGEPTYQISHVVYGAMQMTTQWILAPKLYWDSLSNGAFPHYDTSNGGVIHDGFFASFFLFGDVEAYTQRLADGLTVFMLAPDGDNVNATTVPGYMVYDDISFEVQWVWLSVLIVEYLLGIALLVATILLSRGQPLLKNSATALLACTLSGWDDDELRIPDRQTWEKWDVLTEGMIPQFSEDKKGRFQFNKLT
ncbi:hypothetical protein GGS20DRAFT_590453 [Poronia punctata]|nr:hypothetical protein GGS20DRAFT_590453 [Poronia punctata]